MTKQVHGKGAPKKHQAIASAGTLVDEDNTATANADLQATQINEVFGPVATVRLTILLHAHCKRTAFPFPKSLLELLEHHAAAGDIACKWLLSDLGYETGSKANA